MILRPLRSRQLAVFLLSHRAYPRMPVRTLIAAPRPNSGPLLERRSDRELPDVSSGLSWTRSIPAFLLILGVSTFAIFNYQKLNSPVVASTLYALRTSDKAREVLGDEIYFASKVPLVRGELNQMHGKIDLKYYVKGTKGSGLMRFKSTRPTRLGYADENWASRPLCHTQASDRLVSSWVGDDQRIPTVFQTQEWSLTTPDGQTVQLLEQDGIDPFKQEQDRAMV